LHERCAPRELLRAHLLACHPERSSLTGSEVEGPAVPHRPQPKWVPHHSALFAEGWVDQISRPPRAVILSAAKDLQFQRCSLNDLAPNRNQISNLSSRPKRGTCSASDAWCPIQACCWLEWEDQMPKFKALSSWSGARSAQRRICASTNANPTNHFPNQQSPIKLTH
jgi:hypothetical protein